MHWGFIKIDLVDQEKLSISFFISWKKQTKKRKIKTEHKPEDLKHTMTAGFWAEKFPLRHLLLRQFDFLWRERIIVHSRQLKKEERCFQRDCRNADRRITLFTEDKTFTAVRPSSVSQSCSVEASYDK